MISDMELQQIRDYAEALTASQDSDEVRLGRAITALVEDHNELKQPHVQALTAPKGGLDADRIEAIRLVADKLDATMYASRMPVPLQTHVEGLKGVVEAARDALWETVGKPGEDLPD